MLTGVIGNQQIYQNPPPSQDHSIKISPKSQVSGTTFIGFNKNYS